MPVFPITHYWLCRCLSAHSAMLSHMKPLGLRRFTLFELLFIKWEDQFPTPLADFTQVMAGNFVFVNIVVRVVMMHMFRTLQKCVNSSLIETMLYCISQGQDVLLLYSFLFPFINLYLKQWNSGLMSSRVSLNSWGESISVALVSHPFSNFAIMNTLRGRSFITSTKFAPHLFLLRRLKLYLTCYISWDWLGGDGDERWC